ncbi:MAG: hypothetical protein ACXVQX_10660 [Actinomycetota bacterium]
MAAKRTVAFLALCAIVFTACGGKAKNFTSADLASVILSQSDTPPGMTYIADGSGPKTLDDFTSDSAEKAALTSDGFLAANQVFFANQSAISTLSGGGALTDARVVAAIALVLKTAEGAHKALGYEHQHDISTGTNVTTISVPKIGDESVGIHGTPQGFPFTGYVVSWRVGNAIFAVLVAGGPEASVTLEEATAFAKTMNARAQKV